MKNAEPATASIQPRKEPVQARSRARFERILEVAVDLIVDKGVDGVGMSDIATNAQISIASLYQYFPDKAAIIATLADRFNRLGQTCVRDVFAPVAKPDDMANALHKMIDAYYDFFCTVRGGHAIWQATQSDTRLQAMDAQDIEDHARTISNAFRRVAPRMTKTQCLRMGRLLTGVVATTVRSATTMKPREARATIDLCKAVVITPCVERTLQLENTNR